MRRGLKLERGQAAHRGGLGVDLDGEARGDGRRDRRDVAVALHPAACVRAATADGGVDLLEHELHVEREQGAPGDQNGGAVGGQSAVRAENGATGTMGMARGRPSPRSMVTKASACSLVTAR